MMIAKELPLHYDGLGWNGGKTKIGDLVESIGVRIGEIIHNTPDSFIFLDEDGNVEWLWKDDPPHLGWASARIVELEAKCAFFRANRTRKLFADRMLAADKNSEALAAESRDEPAESGAIGSKSSGGILGSINEIAERASADERIQQQEEELKTKRPDSFRHELSARRFIAQGLVILYSQGGKDEEVSKRETELIFAAAESFIIQRGRETSLIWLYEMLGKLAAGSAFLTMVVLLGGKFWPPLPEEIWKPLACIGVGGLGAYISRALAGRHELPCDANAGRRLHREEALLRWAVGSAAGGVIFLLVKGKVLLGTLPTGGPDFAIPLALAFLSGLSERFLPSMVNRFNEQLAASQRQSGSAQ